MIRSPRVLAVAHDAGGARALIPVVEIVARRATHVAAVVAGPAARLWASECRDVPAEEAPDTLPLADAERCLEASEIDTVLSAGGLYNRIEHTFRLAARARGVRSVAVLDSWLNYGERFARPTDGRIAACHPDVVCVMDDLARRGMIEAGLAPEAVVVTGPPNLERSVGFCRAVSSEQREAWRRDAGAAADDLLVVFFSEPFQTGPGGAHFEGPGALVRPDGTSLYGYTAVDTLAAVLEDLAAASQAAGRRCRVVVKPHPAEWAEPLRSVVAGHGTPWLSAAVCVEGPAARWVATADAAIGMMSIALLEAALAGTPALSVQMGLPESGAEDPCLASVLGHVPAVHDRAALRATAERLVREGPRALAAVPRLTLPVDGAAERVAAVVLEPVPERVR